MNKKKNRNVKIILQGGWGSGDDDDGRVHGVDDDWKRELITKNKHT